MGTAPQSSLRIISRLNQKMVDCIVTITTNADRDASTIWSVVHTAVVRLINRFRDWAICTAHTTGNRSAVATERHPDASGPPSPVSQLTLAPEAGLLLARACLSLLHCPALGAAVVAATGVVETEDADRCSRASSFSWSNVPYLRSVWSAASAPLYQLSDSLTLAALLKATAPIQETFRLRMLETFSGPQSSTSATSTRADPQEPDSDGKQLSQVFAELNHWGDGLPLDVIFPFNEMYLKPDLTQPTNEVNGDAVAVLRTPSNITLVLHETLLDLVNAMNCLTVHGLSSSASTRDFCLRTCGHLLSVYTAVVDLLWPQKENQMTCADTADEKQPDWLISSTSSLQRHAMQLMLDIRFLVRLLIWPLSSNFANKSSLQDTRATLSWQDELTQQLQSDSQALLTRLESSVDPFDWQMCAEQLTTTVVTECLRATKHLYAPLTCSTTSAMVGADSLGSSRRQPASEAQSPAAASLMPLLPATGRGGVQRDGVALLSLPLPFSSYLVSRQLQKHHQQQANAKTPSTKKPQLLKSPISNGVTKSQQQPISSSGAGFLQFSSLWFSG